MNQLYSYFQTALIKIIILGLFIAPSTFAGENYALLIGVSYYPNLAERYHLKGPKNDVLLMKRILLKNGFKKKNIEILADGVTKKLPERNEILTELKLLVKKVKSGDFVYIHFAGHGSQQPAPKNSDEPDGFDEIFLPRDVNKWQSGVGKVENAIVDDEINEFLNQLRKKGAFVWIVFDSCHSSTMTRKASFGNSRFVPPTELGVPKELLKTKQSQQNRSLSTKETSLETKSDNTFVAFYASQTAETTPEIEFDNIDGKTYGLFTHTLSKIFKYNNITYRQAGQLIHNYYAEKFPTYKNSLTPLFEGDLDRLVFGENRPLIPQSWKVIDIEGELKIDAGQLHQLTEGSILELAENPLFKKILAYVEIEKTDIFESTLKKIIYKNKPVLANIPQGAYVRVVKPKFDFSLRVASSSKENKVLKELEKTPDKFLKIKWLKPNDASAHIRLLIDKDRLLLLSANAEQIFSISLSEKVLREKLITHLKSITKVRNLLHLSNKMYTSGKNSNDIQVNIEIDEGKGKGFEDFKIEQIPALFDGTKFKISLNNNSKIDINATILYIDNQYGIKMVFPTIDDERIERTSTIESKGNFTRRSTLNNIKREGKEYLLFIAVPSKPNSMTTDFRYLLQNSIDIDRARSRGNWTNIQDLFAQAAFGVEPARDLTNNKNEEFSMQLFTWQTALSQEDNPLERLLKEYKWQKGLEQAIDKKDKRYIKKFLDKFDEKYNARQPDEQALVYFKKALIIRRELGNKREEAKGLNNLGEILFDLKQYQQALDNFQQALDIQREINDEKGEINSLINIMRVYGDGLRDYQAAYEFQKKAWEIQ